MMMNSELLIDLFERKDKKRRKILYEQYADLLLTSLSAFYVAEMISVELGMPGLVTADDVRYCRFYFRSKQTQRASIPIKSERLLPSSAPEPRTHRTHQCNVKDPSALRWSDPDTMNMQDNIIRKTKFGKKDET
ncbi:hypothetical protein [Dyadobacter sp. 32]|uniref:hypothetical protein n=1 Tax=Dyadobacter sp. 32 TaxID=538966 RepID=UPI0011EC814D